MKALTFIAFLSLLLVSCKGSYVTTSGGKEDIGYIAVIKENPKDTFKQVDLVIDGVTYHLPKIESKAKLNKVKLVGVKPGKHQVKVLHNGRVLVEEQVLVGLQETRKIILR